MSSRQTQVAEARRRRSDQNIETVYKKYAKESGGISRNDFINACQEVKFGLISVEDADHVFSGLLLNENDLLELNEFRRIVNTQSPFEQFISKSIPFHELVFSAMPRLGGKSPFDVFRELSSTEISDIAGAICGELENIMKEVVDQMRFSFEAAQPQERSSRFSVTELKAGNFEDYSKGLSGRIGKNHFRPCVAFIKSDCSAKVLRIWSSLRLLKTNIAPNLASTSFSRKRMGQLRRPKGSGWLSRKMSRCCQERLATDGPYLIWIV